MIRSYFALALYLALYYFTTKCVKCDDTCNTSSTNGRELRGSIDSRRNDISEWVTTFGAERTSHGSETDVNMLVNHIYFECQGKTTVKIEGVIRESLHLQVTSGKTNMTRPEGDYLRFHQKCGSNVNIINKGKTIKKRNINKWDDGVAFTNRPLRDDELFEVIIDAREGKPSNANGIGVTTHSPDDITIPGHMNRMDNGTWMMYLASVYKDGSTINDDFVNLNNVQVGDKIGIKWTSTGDLHLFINGVDKGIAASDVPSPVYGVFELYDNVSKVTIIDH